MIPVFSLTRQNKILDKELQKAIKEVIDGGIYILGPKVAEFEKAFSDYLGVKYAIGVASGTDALSLALLAVGVKPGDEVVLPANAYPTAFALSAIGAIPKLVDIDPITFNIDPTKILAAITKKTKAIIAVHLYGQAVDLASIRQCLKEVGRKIFLIEDCAQAHGAEIRINNPITQSTNNPIEQRSPKNTSDGGRAESEDSSEVEKAEGGWKKVGTIGDVGCFSFYPTKNLGCFGDGGMVVTNNEDIFKKVKLLRMYGEEARYKSIALGRNSRLDELQAAILLLKLPYLDRWNERRRKIALLYKVQSSKFKVQNYNSKLKSMKYSTDTSIIARSEGTPDVPEATKQSRANARKQVARSLDPSADGLRDDKLNDKVLVPVILPHENLYHKHIYHLFVIRSKRRDELKTYLEKKGIQTAIHYPSPIHFQPSFKFLGYKEGDFPQSEKACGEILSLPMFPELADGEVKRIVAAISQFSAIA